MISMSSAGRGNTFIRLAGSPWFGATPSHSAPREFVFVVVSFNFVCDNTRLLEGGSGVEAGITL